MTLSMVEQKPNMLYSSPHILFFSAVASIGSRKREKILTCLLTDLNRKPFKVDNVRVVGSNNCPDELLLSEVSQSLPGSNLMTLNVLSAMAADLNVSEAQADGLLKESDFDFISCTLGVNFADELRLQVQGSSLKILGPAFKIPDSGFNTPGSGMQIQGSGSNGQEQEHFGQSTLLGHQRGNED